MRKDIKFFNIRIKKYTNTLRIKRLILKKKDKVYLLQYISNTKTTFIQITRSSDKLNFAKLELFWIIKVLEPLIYKLKLLEYIKILYIQYISILEPADPDIPVIEDIPDIDPES